MPKILSYIFLCVFIFLGGSLLAQKKKKDPIEKYMPTDNIDYKDDNKRRNRPKRKKIRYIVKNKTKNTLYGNPCMIEATHKMGFEYVLQVPNTPDSMWEVKRVWDNFKTNVYLVITRSPFWKLILNKKLKKCRIKSGDKVG